LDHLTTQFLTTTLLCHFSFCHHFPFFVLWTYRQTFFLPWGYWRHLWMHMTLRFPAKSQDHLKRETQKILGLNWPSWIKCYKCIWNKKPLTPLSYSGYLRQEGLWVINYLQNNCQKLFKMRWEWQKTIARSLFSFI